MPRRVHLVGTCPAESTVAAMTLMHELVGEYLRSIPSGEVDDPDWIVPTIQRREHHPDLRVLKHFRWDTPTLKPWDGAIMIPDRGADLTSALALYYADKAAAALPVWRTMDTEAAFQVGIPGPFDLAAFTFGPGALHFYNDEANAALDEIRIITAMEPKRVIYQLEIPLETFMVAKAPRQLQPKLAARLSRRIGAFINATPADSRWIVHLCVGDPHGKPLVTLPDVSPLVILANALDQAWPYRTHTLDAIHFPFASGTMSAPTSLQFYGPLVGLNISNLTHCLAGMVTLDADEHDQRCALDTIENLTGQLWGVSTPCGMGRRPDAVIPTLDRLAALAAD